MGQMKTPGVYIVEKSAFPNSVVEVATAVPAFIGYTEKAENGAKSLSNAPWRITSMAEYRNHFGGAPMPQFSLDAVSDGTAEITVSGTGYTLNQTAGNYLLYYSMMQFFQNGGGPCYIVSVGGYSDDVEASKLSGGIKPLIKEQEPTMVVIPETMLLDEENCISVQQAMLAHCGGKMRSRIAILDVYNGYRDRQHPDGDCVDKFRSALGINYLDFASAYYPWVNTTIVQDNDISYENIANLDVLQTLIGAELGNPDDSTPKGAQLAEVIANITNTWDDKSPEDKAAQINLTNKSLIALSPAFNLIMREMKEGLNLLPAAASMAGVYTMVDNSRGVWKAPANVSLNAVVSPAVNISHDDQEDLNVTTSGKSINAIRSFIGEGTLVWGARTLDGNSLDWRYVNVRRTMIMLEESIRLASKAYVFEPNVANTWVTIKSMIRNFLTGIWKRGGLAGAVPDDAFSVHVGLGETMTSEDILEGILRVTVLVAISRPAEFIEITFQQQMQKS